MKNLPKEIYCDVRHNAYIMDDYGDKFVLKETSGIGQITGLEMYDKPYFQLEYRRENPRKGVVDTPGGTIFRERTKNQVVEAAEKWLEKNKKYIRKINN